MLTSHFFTLPLCLAITIFFASGCTPGNSQPLPEFVVYKTPTCGCCKQWVEHLKEAGFVVKTTDLADLSDIKERFKVPGKLQSCHTAVVDGYVVEGHVPADVVKRMLDEKPDITGISVPGMPVGSPGMEVAGRAPQRYDVIAFDQQGNERVFAER
jgi:hypothetical protein